MQSNKAKTVLLIDGDVLVYQIGCHVETPIHWGDGLWTLHSEFSDATRLFQERIAELKDTLNADEVRLALSCSTETGFRRQLVPTYKSNRNGNRKPVVHSALREYLLEVWNATKKPRIEADDILGMWATTPDGDRKIIVSLDKDFQGVPCEFYKLSQGGAGVLSTVTEAQADRWHALQTLMGDKVDGYQGIPGVGPVKAEKILSTVTNGDYWPAIVAAYKDAGLSEELALSNARLARILRWGDYNDKTSKLKLWTPSTPKPLPKSQPAPSESNPPAPASDSSKTPAPAAPSAPAPSATKRKAKAVRTSSHSAPSA